MSKKSSLPVVFAFLLACCLSLFVVADTHVFILVGDGIKDSLLPARESWERSWFVKSAGNVEEAIHNEWGIPSKNIAFQCARYMSADGLAARLGEFINDERVGPEDTILFYYVGHGSSFSIDPFFGEGARDFYSYARLNESLAQHPGKIAVILDSCHSGAVSYTHLTLPTN